MIKNPRRTTSSAVGYGMSNTIKYLLGATDIGLGAVIKHLRRTASAAAGSSLGITIKYLR